MKAKLLMILVLLGILVSQNVFARCYKGEDCGSSAGNWQPCQSCAQPACPNRNACNADSCDDLDGNDSCNCFYTAPGTCMGGCGGEGCGSSCNDLCGSCNCTEPSCGRNPCLSARKCCEVFGNIAGTDFDDTGCCPDCYF